MRAAVRVLTWLASLFAWKLVRAQGVWDYYENTVTGRRKAFRVSRCYSPLDRDWLERREPRALPYPPPRQCT